VRAEVPEGDDDEGDQKHALPISPLALLCCQTCEGAKANDSLAIHTISSLAATRRSPKGATRCAPCDYFTNSSPFTTTEVMRSKP
jgi:hypothetical protein